MMRSLIVSLVVCSVFGFPAFSQDTDLGANNEARTPVYFLVDASGSMQGSNKADAELLLTALSLPRDQPVSISYFGAKPESPEVDLCFEDIEVVPPSVRGDDFAPKLPELGGRDDSTAITNAVSSALGKIVGPAKLIVITDGGEECDSNFLRVRDLYPSADIEVLQVGNSPNTDLQKLEKSPSPKIAAPLISPFINLSFRSQSVEESSTAWETGWYERRLWLFALAGLLFGAWLWGSSFGKRANFYEVAAKSLNDKRLAFLKADNISEEQIATAMPDEIDERDAMREGVPDASRSVFALAVALLLGAPLVFFDFQYPTWGRWVASVVLFLVLLVFLRAVIRHVRPESRDAKKIVALKSIASVPLTATLGLAGIGFVVAACWVDLGEAQRASWFVLSADLSAALAVSASAPLVFVGSKWWQFEMAKLNYKHAYSEALSSTEREKRRNAKRLKDDWTSFRTQHFAWRPDIEFTLFGRLATMWDAKAKRARDEVVEKLKSVAIAAGGESATEVGRKRLEEFLSSQSVAERIRLFMTNDFTKSLMLPPEDWDALASALEKKDNRRIPEAYIKLARFLA